MYLNQILAQEKSVKPQVYSEVSALHKILQKPNLFEGLSKSYKSRNEEEGDSLPSENVRVQHTVKDTMRAVERLMTKSMNLAAQKDWTNCHAFGDIIINDKIFLAKVPVTYLLYLEKQLLDIRSMISTIPLLDPAIKWNNDTNSDLMRSEEIKTHRTKKVQRPIVMFPATPEHPAQTQLLTEDIIEGHWTTIKLSGAMGKPQRDAIAEKLDLLISAVKVAREQGNATKVVETPNIGLSIFGFLFAQ